MKKGEFNIRVQRKGETDTFTEKRSGYVFTQKFGEKEYQFGCHKVFEWKITELLTGMCVAKGETRKAAVEELNRVLSYPNNLQYMEQKILDTIDKYGKCN